MDASENFDGLKEILKSEFINKFEAHELDRTRYNEDFDKYALNTIIPGLKIDDRTHYFKGFLNQNGYNNLILPHHNHNETNLIPPDGSQVLIVLKGFNKLKSPLSNSDCINKILKIKSKIFKPSLDTWNVDFLFLSNNHFLSHPGGNHYGDYGSDKIFIGNGIHRLIAYGLALKEIGTFKPIEIYYGHSGNLTT